MSDYAFVHDGKAYTPNGTPVPASDAVAHNATIEARELAQWAERPDRQFAYYDFPVTPAVDHPCLADARVTLWTGVIIGRIVRAHVYRHSFGGRFVSLKVEGNNGATYYGRASYDNGSCVYLRKSKGVK
jgi:hypothetical protein